MEGLLDLHFYDFTFQRKVAVERNTSTARNSWTRNTDRSNEDNPSPQKARRGEEGNFQEGSSSQSQGEGETSSQEYRWRHGKQQERKDALDEIMEEEEQNQTQGGTENEKTQETDAELPREETGKEIETNTEDSEDSGTYFDDILSPGGTHLSFGDFQNMEIKNLFKMQLNERTVVVNEYGTNLIKNKYDPLAVIEAKVAMFREKQHLMLAIL
jgi:hypothetical protein